MQTVLTALIVLLCAWHLALRWMPAKTLAALRKKAGNTIFRRLLPKAAPASCGSGCDSCGDCPTENNQHQQQFKSIPVRVQKSD
jgi:hypothetical protein